MDLLRMKFVWNLALQILEAQSFRREDANSLQAYEWRTAHANVPAKWRHCTIQFALFRHATLCAGALRHRD